MKRGRGSLLTLHHPMHLVPLRWRHQKATLKRMRLGSFILGLLLPLLLLRFVPLPFTPSHSVRALLPWPPRHPWRRITSHHPLPLLLALALLLLDLLYMPVPARWHPLDSDICLLLGVRWLLVLLVVERGVWGLLPCLFPLLLMPMHRVISVHLLEQQWQQQWLHLRCPFLPCTPPFRPYR